MEEVDGVGESQMDVSAFETEDIVKQLLANIQNHEDIEERGKERGSPYEKPGRRRKNSIRERAERPRRKTNTATNRKKSYPLSWYVDHGLIMPVKKICTEDDTSGFDYLLREDWESEDFRKKYTLLEGVYRSIRRLYVIGKENERDYVTLTKRESNGKQTIEIFLTTTASAVSAIQMTTTESKSDLKSDGSKTTPKSRLSGYDYLRFVDSKNNRNSGGSRETKTLNTARKEYETTVAPLPHSNRDPKSLYVLPTEEMIIPQTPEFKEPHPVISRPTQEEQIRRFDEFLSMPEMEDGCGSPKEICIEDGMTLSNGVENIKVGVSNLVSLPDDESEEGLLCRVVTQMKKYKEKQEKQELQKLATLLLNSASEPFFETI